jgi:hypothetical protein
VRPARRLPEQGELFRDDGVQSDAPEDEPVFLAERGDDLRDDDGWQPDAPDEPGQRCLALLPRNLILPLVISLGRILSAHRSRTAFSLLRRPARQSPASRGAPSPLNPFPWVLSSSMIRTAAIQFPISNTHAMHYLRLLVGLTIPWIGLAAIAADAPAVNTNRFHSSTAGFAVIKPAAWQFASMEQVATNRAVARLKDKELEAQIRQRASAPLVVILKHPEPHDDLNPSVQVMVRPLGQLEGKSAMELMRLVVPTIQRAMADFAFVEQIQETKLGGMPAAFMKAKYTVANPEGREFKTLSRMWIVPRGSFMFMISASGPQEGADVSEAEFKGILDSIQIEK